MSINPDDPKLTAYALNELEGNELKEVEKQLSESEAARHEVAEISRTAQQLTRELAAEPMPVLTYAQQLEIKARVETQPPKREHESWWSLRFPPRFTIVEIL